MTLWRAITNTGSAFVHCLTGVGPCCRFSPSCSEYAHMAICRHGVLKGFLLSLGRIVRCHPWGSHGRDPVPDTF